MLICEAGHSRSLLTKSFRYIFAPQTRKSAADLQSFATRHPGIHNVEQLYDLQADPGEEKELIQSYGLIASGLLPSQFEPLTGAKETRAATAFRFFRQAMQRDLVEVAARCGV